MAEETDRWFETSDVIPMFPSLVWQIQLRAARHEAIDAKILAVLARMRSGAPLLAPGRGWQSVPTLHQLDELQELVDCVNHATRGILRFWRIGCDAFEITGCWATVLAPGASHRMHSHPNNFLCAIYYVQTQPGADSVNFHDPRIQTGIIRPPVVERSPPRTPIRSSCG